MTVHAKARAARPELLHPIVSWYIEGSSTYSSIRLLAARIDGLASRI
jgi:hypothetical protein